MFLKLCWVAFPKMPAGLPQMEKFRFLSLLQPEKFYQFPGRLHAGGGVPKITETKLFVCFVF